MGINYKPLVEQFRAEPVAARGMLREAFAKKQLRPGEFEFGRLFEECFGMQDFRECRAGNQLMHGVMESQGAVTSAAFMNITGQIVYSAVMDAYEAEEFVFSKLIPEVPTTLLDGEKIPGITEIGDESTSRAEGMPYSLAGIGEDWIFTPAIRDFGMIVPVTWEAVFMDKTGLVLTRAGDVGKWRATLREKQAIDCVIDENSTRHRYNWRGTVIASYGDNSGTHTWDNLAASNALVDWTDVDAAEQVFNGLVNPYTGEPIKVDAKHLVVTKQLEQTARRIVSATEIRVATPGYATTGNPTQTNMANPYASKYEVVTSRLLAARLATDTTWFLGDFSKYAKYMVAEKMNVIQAPTNNSDEFNRRIVAQYRVNERGEYVVVEPRAAVTCTA